MKYLKYLKLCLLGIGALVVVLLVVTGNPEGKLVAQETIADYAFLGAAMNTTIAFLIVAAILAFIMPIFSIVQDPKKSLKSLLGVGIVVVIWGVLWAMADTTAVQLSDLQAPKYDDAMGLKFTSSGLAMTGIALASTLLAIVGTEFYRIFK